MRGLVAIVAAAALATIFGASSSSARTLAEVRARGALSLCANPDALPYASNRADAPGFQIEIARAIAAALDLKLQVEWIVPRMRASLVDCDMLLDTIVDPALERGPLKLSRPYQRSGVALAVRTSGNENVRGFADIAPGKRVGVMVNSVASKLLNQRGLYTVPYAFESDMVVDLVKGDLDACAISPAMIAYYIHTHAGSGLRFFSAYDAEPELRWTLAAGLRRSDDALLDAVNGALDRLLRDGTIARAYANYGVEFRAP